MKKSELKALINETIQEMAPQFNVDNIMVRRAKEAYDSAEAQRNEAWRVLAHATRDSDISVAHRKWEQSKAFADAAYEKWGQAEEAAIGKK